MPFDPTQHPNILYYVPNIADVPGAYFIGNNSDGGAAVNAGDLVGTIQTGLSGINFTAGSIAPSTERRPVLASDGFGNLGIAGASTKLLRHGTIGYANAIHENREAWGIVVFKMDTSIGAANRPFIDNTNFANSNASSSQGFTAGTNAFSNGLSVGGIYRKTSGSVARARIKNATTTPVIELNCEEDLSEASPTIHVLIFRIDPDGLSYAQVDNGRKSYDLCTATAGSGNPPQLMGLMNRASVSTQIPGTLLSLGLYSAYPGDDALDEWLERWPLGAIAGSPEIRVQNMHQNFSKDQAGMPYCIWFNKKRVSGLSVSGNEGGQNVVFNDGVSTDYLGGAAGWCGGPHRNETLVSATVSVDGATPTALTNGQVYEGNSSVLVVRTTTMGGAPSYTQVETNTITRNTQRVNTVLTRLGDARTINPLVFRLARHQCNDFVSFDADGAVIDDSSVTAEDYEAPTDCVAIAQWYPTGLMALSVITKGAGLTTPTILYDATDGTRRINYFVTSPPTGTSSIEFETLSKFYETTEGEWKSLAQREVQNQLFPRASARNRVPVGTPRRLASSLLGR